MEKLLEALQQRILIMDGAMGTMIQRYRLDEAGYRGTQFANHPRDLKGANDILCLTNPKIVEEIHRQYLDAGADILETNTFNAQAISLADYDLIDYAYDINRALGAKEMRPHIEELAAIAPVYLSCYPNAGLPNALGDYDQTPDEMAALLHEYAGNNWINIVGGCCGTTPEYIRSIAQAVKS